MFFLVKPVIISTTNLYNVHFSVCEAIDGETRSLVLRSGVHELFISIIKDPKVSGMYKASR